MRTSSKRRRATADETAFDAARELTYPPPYPSGWYKVADASALDNGRVVRVDDFGEQLALFRDARGNVSALDRRCPHLGADLSDGVVKHGCIECPFHQWRFRGDGSVSHIPYQERVPAALRARTWPVREWHGMILVYHAHHAADRNQPPLYELPAFDEITRGQFVSRGRHALGVVRMHLIEFAENGPDYAHFAPLHSAMTIPWTQIRIPFATIDHRVAWSTDPVLPHVAHFDDEASLRLFDRPWARSKASARVSFIGPGSLGVFRFEMPGVGTILMMQFHTPEAPMRQRVELRWFAEPRVPRALVYYVIGNWVSQLAADVRIWERKSYNARPMLVENDGPTLRFRQWYRQFYEPASSRSSATEGNRPPSRNPPSPT